MVVNRSSGNRFFTIVYRFSWNFVRTRSTRIRGSAVTSAFLARDDVTFKAPNCQLRAAIQRVWCDCTPIVRRSVYSLTPTGNMAAADRLVYCMRQPATDPNYFGSFTILSDALTIFNALLIENTAQDVVAHTGSLYNAPPIRTTSVLAGVDSPGI